MCGLLTRFIRSIGKEDFDRVSTMVGSKLDCYCGTRLQLREMQACKLVQWICFQPEKNTVSQCQAGVAQGNVALGALGLLPRLPNSVYGASLQPHDISRQIS